MKAIFVPSGDHESSHSSPRFATIGVDAPPVRRDDLERGQPVCVRDPGAVRRPRRVVGAGGLRWAIRGEVEQVRAVGVDDVDVGEVREGEPRAVGRPLGIVRRRARGRSEDERPEPSRFVGREPAAPGRDVDEGELRAVRRPRRLAVGRIVRHTCHPGAVGVDDIDPAGLRLACSSRRSSCRLATRPARSR